MARRAASAAQEVVEEGLARASRRHGRGRRRRRRARGGRCSPEPATPPSNALAGESVSGPPARRSWRRARWRRSRRASRSSPSSRASAPSSRSCRTSGRRRRAGSGRASHSRWSTRPRRTGSPSAARCRRWTSGCSAARRGSGPSAWPGRRSRAGRSAIGLALMSAWSPTSAASPSDVSAGVAAALNGPSCLMTWLICGAAALRSVSTGVIWSARPPSRCIVGLSSRQEGRQLLQARLDVAAALGAGDRRLVGLVDEVGDVRLVAGQRAQDLVAVLGQLGERLVLVGEDLQDLVGLLEGRVGLPDRLAQLRAVGGQAGAELVDDDREALAVGQPHDVAHQVEVDRLDRLGVGQQVLALARARA